MQSLQRLLAEKTKLHTKAEADGISAGREFALSASYQQLAYVAESTDLGFLASSSVFADELLGDTFVDLREAVQLPSSAWTRFVAGWRTGALQVWRQLERLP